MKKSYNKAFTLVELLAVIVILAIILVIAVPKIMDVINSSKKSTLETSVKMIASSAEKTKMQNAVLGKEDATITCDSVAKLSNSDYESCTIEFDGNTAKVTVKGKGKFEGLNVCGGTKNEATAQKEMCATDGKYFTYEKAIEVEDISKCTAYFNSKYSSFKYNNSALCNGTYGRTTISAAVNALKIPASEFEEAGLKLSDTYIVINGYNTEGGLDVVIPSTIDGYTVVEIGKNAFYDDRHYTGLGIKSVIIPNTVRSIGEQAFMYNELTNVTIPYGVITIGRLAFVQNDLASITIASSVITIGERSFRYNNLASITIPSSVTSIDEYAFNGNPLTKVELSNPNIEIGFCAFGYKENITSHNLPDTYDCQGEPPPS